MAAPDMDVIKEIPGYKVILKAIIKAQIQQLVEQLAAHTDEESVILTASVADGTLSHLGSDSGKGFLEEQEDVKSQFLGFCLKRHHKKLQAEKEKDRLKALAAQAPLQSQYDMGPGPRRPQRMPYHSTPRQQFSPQGGFSMRSPLQRHEPYHIPRPNRRQSFTESSPSAISTPTVNFGAGLSGDNVAMKMEPSDSDNQNGAGSESNTKDDDNTNSSFGTSELSGNRTGENTQEGQEIDPKSVKVEAISESDFELEITGVEPGQSMLSQDNWDPNVSIGMNFDPSQGASGTSADMPGQQGFNAVVKSLVYVCSVCGKIMQSRAALKRHIRIHSGEQPFTCRICLRKFNQKGSLKRHHFAHHRGDEWVDTDGPDALGVVF